MQVQESAADNPTTHQTAFSWRETAFLFIAALAAFSFHVWRGLYVDEYVTWNCTTQDPVQLIENRLKAGHFPTYFLLINLWAKVAGVSEIALRLPSILLVIPALFIFRHLARDLFGAPTARVASILFVSHQLVVWTAQTARAYNGMLLCSIIVAYSIYRWWQGKRIRWLLALVLSGAVGFSFQAAFALAIGAFVFAMLPAVRHDPRRVLPVLIALIVPVLLLALPASLLAEKQQKYAYRDIGFSMDRLLNGLSRVFLGDYRFWARGAFKYVMLPASAWLLWESRQFLRTRTKSPSLQDGRFPAGFLVWSWAVFPAVGLALVEGFASENVMAHPRYFIPALGGMLLLGATGIVHMASRSIFRRCRFVPLAATLALMLPCTVGWWLTNGDGPHVVAGLMAGENSNPQIVAGTTLPLSYEWRNHPERKLVSLYHTTSSQARQRLESLSPHASVWLFVYDNEKNWLDEILEEPPKRFRVGKRIKHANARAALFVPAAAEE